MQVVQRLNFNLSTDSLLPPHPHPLYCIHYQLAPPLMSQTGVIDLSVINKNLSIRFRSKFRKQSEGSISNYLRAIPFARACFQLSNGNTRMIAWVIAKTVKGEGLIYSEEFFILTTLIIWVIRKCGLCDNFDPSCWGAGLWWSVRQKLSVVTSDGIPPSQLWAGSAQLVIEWIN